MIGKKKLSAIREEVREALAKDDFNVEQWFDEQVRKLEGHRPSDRLELDTLLALRRALASAAKAAPKKRGRRATSG